MLGVEEQTEMAPECQVFIRAAFGWGTLVWGRLHSPLGLAGMRQFVENREDRTALGILILFWGRV